MKFSAPVFAIAFLAFVSASAQVVTVEVKLEQDQFLPSEAMPVTVRVFNNSGQTLHLGADENWLQFNVQSADNNFPVLRNGTPPVMDEFDLASSEVATKRLDIAPYFSMKHPGRYRVAATVHIPEWGKDVSSAPKDFDVINGSEILSRDFGVPLPAGISNRPPEVRKYVLEQANYLRQQLRMYVMVTDQMKQRIFKVKAIGPMVSFSQPEAQLDGHSNLHVLYQSGAQTFIYSVVNPNGDIVQQDLYDMYDTRPRLGMDGNGNIIVVGGVRRMRPGELPSVKMPDEVPAPAQK